MALAQQSNLFGAAPSKAPAAAAPPEVSVKYAAFRELGKPVYRNELGKVYLDPRPDIDDGSEEWVTLLAEADRINPKLWDALLGFRCIGARLLETTDGAYVLRPHIDPSGDSGFRSQEEYRLEAERWLKPNADQVKQLLANLRKVKKAMWGNTFGK